MKKNILRKIKPAAHLQEILFHPLCKYDWCENNAFGLPIFSGNI